MSYSMNAVYRQLQISKQAVYQSKKRQHSLNSKWYDLQGKIDAIRKTIQVVGLRRCITCLNQTLWAGISLLIRVWTLVTESNERKTIERQQELRKSIIQT